MFQTIVRRLAILPIMIVGVTLMTFVITHLIPADPARVAAGLNAPESQVQRLRVEMGLNKPILVQYWVYLRNLARGDWGVSAISQRPVLNDIAQSLPATLELLIFTTIGFIIVGIPFGVFIGSASQRWRSAVMSFIGYTGMAFPVFWLGLMFQIIFYGKLGWFPVAGRIGTNVTPPHAITGFYTVDSLLTGDWAALWSTLYHMVLPVTCLTLARFAVTARFVAAGMQAAMRTDYVRTAFSKGISRRSIIFKHALRNVLIPVNTMLGLQFGWLLGSSILVEAVFSYPGIGWYAWRSIVSLDFLPIMGVTLVFSLAFIIINLVTDILYEVLDPRITLTARKA